jgi:hypothetical protein
MHVNGATAKVFCPDVFKPVEETPEFQNRTSSSPDICSTSAILGFVHQ